MVGGKIFGHRVFFLHRTVRDFLLTNNILTLLQSWTTGHFDSRESLCKLTLAQIKALSIPSEVLDIEVAMEHAEDLLCQMITYAHEVEIHRGVSAYDLLNEFDRTLAVYLNYVPKEYLYATPFESYDTNAFLVSVTRAGLCIYVSKMLDEQPTMIRKAAHKPSLLEATIYSPPKSTLLRAGSSWSGLPISYNVDMARMLFARGANPNVHTGDGNATVWQRFLKGLYEVRRDSSVSGRLEGIPDRAFEMTGLFISNGADLGKECLTGEEGHASGIAWRSREGGIPSTSMQVRRWRKPLEILEPIFPPSQLKQLKALCVERRQARAHISFCIPPGRSQGIKPAKSKIIIIIIIIILASGFRLGIKVGETYCVDTGLTR